MVYDPPPPYGGVSVSSENTLKVLKKFNDIKYIPHLFDSSRKSLLWSIIEFAQNVKKSDAILFQIGDIFRLLRNRGLIYFAVAYFSQKEIIYRGFAGGLFIKMFSIKLRQKLLLKFLLTKTSLITFQTKDDLNNFTKVIKNRGKIKYLPNTRRRVLNEINNRKVATRFCFIGKVCVEKGVHHLVNFSKHLPNTLVIDLYGPLSNSDRFLTGINNLNEDSKVSYKGQLPPNRVQNVLRKYDCLILPTTWKTEGHPGVILEAFSVGVPVISTHWNGIPELVDDSSGILCNPNALSEEVLNAILFMHKHPSSWKQYCQGALKKINEFQPDVWGQRFHNMILDTIR